MSANTTRNNLIMIAITAIALFGILWLSPQASFAEGENSEETIVLNVCEDSKDNVVKSFTLDELSDIWQREGNKTHTYSALNTYPASKVVEKAGGPELQGIFDASGIDIDSIDDNQCIEFIGGDGIGLEFLKKQIFANRYYYPKGSVEADRAGKAPLESSWEEAENVPAILTLTADEESNKYRLLFGQVSPNEQTWQASIQYIISETRSGYIVIHRNNGEAFNAIETTDLGKGGPFLKGKAVTLTRSVNRNPVGMKYRYTIYYTTDGTSPDPASKTSQIYNYNNINFGNSSEKINKPIIPSGKITIKTKVVGYGMQDSDVSEFSFTGVASPGKVAGIKVSAISYQSIKTTWNSVSGVSGYQVGRYDSSKKAYIPVKSVSSGSALTFTNSGLKTGTTYYYRVRAYKTVSGKTFYGSWSDTGKATPVLSKTTISSITAKRKALRLTWKKIAGANGYQIYRATKKTGSYKLVKTISKQGTISWTNSNLKKKKTYWYKIRAYRVVSGKKVYSSFSAVRYKRTK